MKPIILLLLVSILPILLLAQNETYATGLELDDPVYDTLNRIASYQGTKDANLPIKIDLSPYCPEVRNQGEIYSCVGWSVGYAAMTIQKAIKNGWTNKRLITENAYSALFIYNQIKPGSCKRGSKLSDAMEFLRKRGDCLARDFDHDIENCEILPDPQLSISAKRDTIEDYMTLFAAKAPAEEKINKIRRALAQKTPVIIGLSIRQNFFTLKNAKYWWPEVGNKKPAGGHAITVVGYDDQSKSFLLFNSWGKKWGDKGYIRIKYKYFATFCKYAFILHKNINPEPVAIKVEDNPKNTSRALKQLSGSFQLKYLRDFSDYNQEPVFSIAPTQGKKGYYQLQQKDWNIGQLFQIFGQIPQKDIYLYVFSIDALNNIHIHWPRKQQLNQKFTGLNESALVTEPNARLVIPGPTKALKFAHAGKDVIYVFFSLKKIKHLRFICEKMRYSKDNPMKKLQDLMGKHLIPKADIEYDSRKMKFQANTRSNGYIVPMILEVTGR